jgi:hypothetical protein
MVQKIINKKKKRKIDSVLCIDFSCLDKNQERRSYEDIKNKIKEMFRYHIGKENAITPYELFYSIFGINPQMVSIFEREYFWNIIKNIMRELRKTETVFIINTGQKLFVLKSNEELQGYKKKIDRHIEDLKVVKKKAIDWVEKEKWKRI